MSSSNSQDCAIEQRFLLAYTTRARELQLVIVKAGRQRMMRTHHDEPSLKAVFPPDFVRISKSRLIPYVSEQFQGNEAGLSDQASRSFEFLERPCDARSSNYRPAWCSFFHTTSCIRASRHSEFPWVCRCRLADSQPMLCCSSCSSSMRRHDAMQVPPDVSSRRLMRLITFCRQAVTDLVNPCNFRSSRIRCHEP